MRTINRASDVLTLNHETKAVGIWGDVFSVIGVVGLIPSTILLFLCIIDSSVSVYPSLIAVILFLTLWFNGSCLLCIQSIADNARQTNYLLMYQCGLLRSPTKMMQNKNVMLEASPPAFFSLHDTH